MPPLRFKGDSTSVHRKKRRRLESDQRQLSASPVLREESLTPPRNGFTKTYQYNLKDGFSWEETDRDDFEEKLRDALLQDEGLDRADFHVPKRWRHKNGVESQQSVNGQGAVLNEIVLPHHMNEQEYAEYLNSGMYKRTNAEAQRISEELAKEKKDRERKLQAERDQARKAEQDRIRALEQQRHAYDLAKHQRMRESYSTAWKKLLDGTDESSLSTADFAWPVAPGSPVNKDSIKFFLLSHLSHEDSKTHKQALRAAVLAYHPDRFDRLVARLQERDRTQVKEMGLRVSQLVNELLTEA